MKRRKIKKRASTTLSRLMGMYSIFIKSDHKIYGIGSGGAYALGYLYDRLGRLTIGNVNQHAEKAVQIASMLDINTCPPIQLVTQRRELG
jgi:ATP-dependent protease HslVU (ClpYQ) peptidase subunit